MHRGELDEAEAIARSADEYAFRTDFPLVRADALAALSRVLRSTGREACHAGARPNSTAVSSDSNSVKTSTRASHPCVSDLTKATSDKSMPMRSTHVSSVRHGTSTRSSSRTSDARVTR